MTLTLESADESREIELTTFARSGSFSVRDDWVCPEYGKRIAVQTCTFRIETNGNAEIVTFIVPSAAIVRKALNCVSYSAR